MELLKKFIALIVLLGLAIPVSADSVRIKDITAYRNDAEIDLIGYGLIIGLDGTGDSRGTQFTIQSLVNMMERMGLTANPSLVKVKNVAAVIVTARLSSANQPGSRVDVTVSSIGDATSLQGGILLVAPLSSSDGEVYATAQGPVSIGGFNVQLDNANKIVNNYALVGRVPGGALVQRQLAETGNTKDLYLTLFYPDYTTVSHIVDEINRVYGQTAYAVDEGSVRVHIPDSLDYPNDRIEFISNIGSLRVSPDATAKVVINEKTGTIVAGESVSIAPVALAHGNLTINIRSLPVVSQPNAFSTGVTTTTAEGQITAQEELARVVQFPEVVTISDMAAALNNMGATPRDIIAIFEALKQTGALRAELVIL